MPVFSYLGTDARGREVDGAVDASSLSLALQSIRSLGHFPTDIRQAERAKNPPARLRNRLETLFRKTNLRNQILVFMRQLAVMLSSGMSLSFSLAVLQERQKRGVLRDTLAQIADDIEGGLPLSGALEKHPKLFDGMYVEMVRLGERSGNFEGILSKLADFVEERETIAGNARKNFRQTVIGVVVGYGILMYFSKVVFPVLSGSFWGLFLLSEMQYPRYAVWIFAVFWFLLFCLTIGALIGVSAAPRAKSSKRISHRYLFKMPGTGKIFRLTAVAQFSRSLGYLLLCGAPAAEAVAVAKNQVRNRPARKAFEELHEKVKSGEPLGETLMNSNLFSPPASNLITNAAPEAFGPALLKIAGSSERDGELHIHQTRRRIVLAAIFIAAVLIIFGMTYQQIMAAASGCGPGG